MRPKLHHPSQRKGQSLTGPPSCRMSHRLLKVFASLTPAKLKAWRRFIVILGFFFLVLLVVVLVLALLLVWTLSELDKLGYGPVFFMLRMGLASPWS